MNVGFVDGIYWVRVATSFSEPGRWILETNNPTLQEISVWLVDEDRIPVHVGKAGLKPPFHVGRPFKLLDFVFVVDVPFSGNYFLYYRIDQQGYLDLPARLVTPEQSIGLEPSDAYHRGLYYGLFASILMLTFVYLVITRDISFLAFGAFISGFSLVFGYIDGVASQSLWPNVPFLNLLVIYSSLPLMNIGISWFALTFLDAPSSLKWLCSALKHRSEYDCS